MATILLIDDDVNQREILARLLRREGYTAVGAGHGKEALEHLQKQAADLILLDLFMPVMDGVSFLQELRRQEQWKRLPVMLVTVASEGVDLAAADGLGVVGCFTKGHFSYDALSKSIRGLLSDEE